MKLNHTLVALAILAMLSDASASNTGSEENVIYIGVGSAKNGDPATTSDKSPISLGYLRLSKTSGFVWGADITREGSMLDSTWNQRSAIKQAMSYNLLIGGNLTTSDSSRFDAALILGAREKTSSCPSSFIGYQCYANSEPDVEYATNYGAVLTWTYKSLLLGLRLTGESRQAMAGFRF